jgi:O-antigen/teichoic acid export membrane protein
MVLVLRARGFALPVRSDPALVRPIAAKAAPLVGHAILGLLIFNSDLIFLRYMRDEGTAGLYAAAYALVSFLLNVGTMFGVSLLPVFTRLAGDAPRQRQLFENSMAQVLTVALPVAAGGCLVAAGMIGLVFGPAYAASALPLQILIWSIVAAWMRTVNTYSLIALHQQSFVLRTTAWSAAINIVLNILLIPRWGMAGAAVATLATEALRTVIGLAYGIRFGLAMGFVPRLWRPLLATAVMAALLWFVPLPHVLVAIAAGAVVYGAVLFATGGIRFSGGRLALTV